MLIVLITIVRARLDTFTAMKIQFSGKVTWQQSSLTALILI